MLLLPAPSGNKRGSLAARMSHNLFTKSPCFPNKDKTIHDTLTAKQTFSERENCHLPFPSLSLSCLITLDLGVCLVYINKTVALCRPFPCCQQNVPFGRAADVCSLWVLPVLSRLWVNLIESERRVHSRPRQHTRLRTGIAHNGPGCWSVLVFNWAQKPVLCLAVIEGAGACSSLITLYGVMESFMVDLMHKCFASCYYCRITMYRNDPIMSKSDTFYPKVWYCPWHMFAVIQRTGQSHI